MSAVAVSIPVPVANGVGATVAITSFGYLKNVIIAGTFQASVTLEASPDGVNWGPIATYTKLGCDTQGFAALFARARVTGYINGVATMTLAAELAADPALAVTLPVPGANGAGAAIATSTLGELKTITVNTAGLFIGAVNIESSDDGVTWGCVATFTDVGLKSVALAAQFMRTRMDGYVSGSATCAVAAIAGGGAGGAVSLQDAYDAGSSIVENAARLGITITDFAGLTNPMLRIDRNASTFPNGIGLLVSGTFGSPVVAPLVRIDAESTGVVGLEIHKRNGVGIRVTEDQPSGSFTALGNAIEVVYATNGSTGVMLSLSKTPPGPGNTAGTMFSLTTSATVTGRVIDMVHAGSGIAFAIDHAPTIAGAGPTVNITRNPVAVTSLAGVMVLSGSSMSGDILGITMFATVTGAGVRITSNQTSSTGNLLVLNKTPPAASAGSLLTLTTNANAITAAIVGTHAGTGAFMSVAQTGTGDGITLTHTPTVLTVASGISVTLAGGAANSQGSAISITSNGGGAGNGLRVTHSGSQNAVQVTHTGSGAGVVITHSGLSTSSALAVTVSPAAATSTGGISVSVNANSSGVPLNITSNGSGIAAVQIAASTTATGMAIRVVHSTATSTAVDIACSTGTGANILLSRAPAVATGGISLNISHNANATGTAINVATNSVGVALAATKQPAVATAGNLITLLMGGGAGAVSGDTFGVTDAATHTGRFLTLSHLGTGEVWRITGTAGAITSVLDSVGRLGLGVVPATPARFAIKDHAAFAGSALQETTGAVQTVGAVTGDALTLLLADNTTYILEALVVGRASGGTERAAYVVRAGCFRQGGGGATLIGAGSPQADFTDETTAAADATIVMSGNNAIVRVTGVAAQTYNWVCSLRWQAVQTNA